jgi:hypothetical protein
MEALSSKMPRTALGSRYVDGADSSCSSGARLKLIYKSHRALCFNYLFRLATF